MKDGGGEAWGGVAQDSGSREGHGAPMHSVRQASAVGTEAAAHGGQKDNSNVYDSRETGAPEAMAANPGPVGLPVRSTNPPSSGFAPEPELQGVKICVSVCAYRHTHTHVCICVHIHTNTIVHIVKHMHKLPCVKNIA